MTDVVAQTAAAVVDLTDLSAGCGVVVEAGFSGRPDASAMGELLRKVVRLPGWSQAAYFAAYQDHDPMGASAGEALPVGNNRVQSLRRTDWRGAKRGGVQALVELEDGRVLALLPLVARGRWRGWARRTASWR